MPVSREQQRVNRANKYSAYKRLLADLDVDPQWERWDAHHNELRSTPLPARLTKAEHFAYWTERFTTGEIRELGGAIDFLLREREAA